MSKCQLRWLICVSQTAPETSVFSSYKHWLSACLTGWAAAAQSPGFVLLGCTTIEHIKWALITYSPLIQRAHYGIYLNETLLLWIPQPQLFCLHWWRYLALTLSAEPLCNGAAAAASGSSSMALISCSHYSTWGCISGSSLFTLPVPKLDLKGCLLRVFFTIFIFFFFFFHQNISCHEIRGLSALSGGLFRTDYSEPL